MTRTGALLAAIALCVSVGAILGGRALSQPGLYYDEVIQAGPAVAFLDRDARPPAIPGMRATRVAGRWLPWMTQPYMGALKSQLLIPVFAVVEPGVAVLRGTTLAWALLGIALSMVWIRRACGTAVAALTGLLLAVDPSLLFIGRHDWGSFSLGLLLRGAALSLLIAGWQRRTRPLLLAGGVCVGLGLYNKVDFAVFVAGAGAALCVARPGVVREALGARRSDAALAIAGGAVGALPLLLALGGALAAAEAMQAAQGSGGDLAEKLALTWSVLDGSYFQRLVLAGGRFDALFDVEAVSSPAAWVLVLCATGLAARVLRARATGAWSPRRAAEAFALLTLLFTLIGLWLTPRAVRVHHTLNAWPFPQLVIALAAAALWRAAASGAGARAVRPSTALARLAAVALLGAAIAGDVRVDLATVATLRETGGRGRWSDALARYLETLPPGARLVGLDWGFDGPVRFLAPERDTRELVWGLRRPRPAGLTVRIPGDADDVYLVYDAPYAVFPYGAALRRAIEDLPPDAVVSETRRDREGQPVFHAIRFAAPHDLLFRGERAEVRLR